MPDFKTCSSISRQNNGGTGLGLQHFNTFSYRYIMIATKIKLWQGRFAWSVDKHWSRRGFGGLGRRGFVVKSFVRTLAAVTGMVAAVAECIALTSCGLVQCGKSVTSKLDVTPLLRGGLRLLRPYFVRALCHLWIRFVYSSGTKSGSVRSSKAKMTRGV